MCSSHSTPKVAALSDDLTNRKAGPIRLRPVPPHGEVLVARARLIARRGTMVKHEALKNHLDSLRSSILESKDWLGHFHLGEPNRRPPRRGRMPWAEIFGALRAINYQGALVMEPFLVPGGDVGRDISVFRDLLGSDDLDEEAARSVEFVRSEQNPS